MIKVVGLGCKKDQLTIEGAKIIKEAKKVFIKTMLTETYTYFKENNIEVISFDSYYEEMENFDKLDSAIVNTVLESGDCVYCVNGSGFEDRSVIELSKKTKITIYPSVSLGANFDIPNLAKTYISAYELISKKGFNYDTRCALVIYDVDNEYVASDVKLVLSNILGDDQDIYFNDKLVKVFEIDRQEKYDYSTIISCAPINVKDKHRFNFLDLYQIMKILRSENGCDWDKVQTHESIRENVIEEAYELVDAINKKDVENMIEESGDVMLQSIFHCIIGEDMGEYNAEDALSSLCSKLIFRHPHVFGDIKANNKDEALKAWDEAKAKEKNQTSYSQKMDEVTQTLPTLLKSRKILSYAKKAGVLSNSKEDTKEKLSKAIEEFYFAPNEKRAGDLLLCVIYLLKLCDIDAEVALRKSTEEFIEDFKKFEDN